MNMKLSPPWITYANEVKELFRQDPDVTVVYDDEAKKLQLFVEGDRKANALERLLGSQKTFGNVTVKIEIVPANVDDKDPTVLDDLKAALDGNDALSIIYDEDTPFGHLAYVVFAPEIVQFWNDDMGDVNGNKTTLFQEIARDVFPNTGSNVFFCTDAINPLHKPLGEWP